MFKINWFDANRSMSIDVANYMMKFVWSKEIHEKFKREREECELSLAGCDKFEGSILADKIPEMKAVYYTRLGILEEQEKKQLELEGTYELNEADKELRKGLKSDPVKALQKWFSYHGLELPEDAAIFDEIFSAAGETATVKQFVHTGGRIASSFNTSNCFRMTFVKCYEHMVNAGTIKATQIPPLMAEKYAPKKKSNKKGKKQA